MPNDEKLPLTVTVNRGDRFVLVNLDDTNSTPAQRAAVVNGSPSYKFNFKREKVEPLVAVPQNYVLRSWREKGFGLPPTGTIDGIAPMVTDQKPGAIHDPQPPYEHVEVLQFEIRCSCGKTFTPSTEGTYILPQECATHSISYVYTPKPRDLETLSKTKAALRILDEWDADAMHVKIKKGMVANLWGVESESSVGELLLNREMLRAILLQLVRGDPFAGFDNFPEIMSASNTLRANVEEAAREWTKRARAQEFKRDCIDLATGTPPDFCVDDWLHCGMWPQNPASQSGGPVQIADNAGIGPIPVEFGETRQQSMYEWPEVDSLFCAGIIDEKMYTEMVHEKASPRFERVHEPDDIRKKVVAGEISITQAHAMLGLRKRKLPAK